MMNFPVLVPGVLIAAAGILCGLFPARYTALAETLLARRDAKVIAGGVRLVLGALILAGAADARHPTAVAAFGVLLAVAGVVLLMLPRPRFDALAQWGVGLSPSAVRLASLAALALGGWLALAAGG